MQPGLVLLAREFHRLLGAAGQSRFNRKQRGSATIPHISFGPLNVRSRRRFFERILRINRPILGLPALGTPSAAIHPMSQSPIQRRPVRAGLVAGNDFDWLHFQTKNDWARWYMPRYRRLFRCELRSGAFSRIPLGSSLARPGNTAVLQKVHAGNSSPTRGCWLGFHKPRPSQTLSVSNASVNDGTASVSCPATHVPAHRSPC
jgi:hypothetical protein